MVSLFHRATIKKCTFNCFLNFAASVMVHKSSGCAFYAAGPVYENVCSRNFVCNRGSVKSVNDTNQSLERVRPAPTDSTMFVRYAGHAS